MTSGPGYLLLGLGGFLILDAVLKGHRSFFRPWSQLCSYVITDYSLFKPV